MNHYKRRERGKKRYVMYVCEFRSLWEVNFLLKVSDMLMLLMAKAEVQFFFCATNIRCYLLWCGYGSELMPANCYEWRCAHLVSPLA